MHRAVLICVFASVLGGAFAAKPQRDTTRVWPSYVGGEHFNLNIHGRDKFSEKDCSPDITYIDGTETIESYGNSIFVLNAGAVYKNDQPLPDGIDTTTSIVFESGNTKGKQAKLNDFSIYGVRDPCAAAWDGTPATLVLPPEEEGYYVVLRMLGKPAKEEGDSQFEITNADLSNVLDENNNDLYLLGLVTSNGFETPDVQVRYKGKSPAVDISAVFDFNGNVCYFQDVVGVCNTENPDYCWKDGCDAPTTCTSPATDSGIAPALCCFDTNGDGIIGLDNDGASECTAALLNTTLCATEPCPEDAYYCEDEAATLDTVLCQAYEDEWVFNIGDLVKYYWETHTTGGFKLAQVRFYPVAAQAAAMKAAEDKDAEISQGEKSSESQAVSRGATLLEIAVVNGGMLFVAVAIIVGVVLRTSRKQEAPVPLFFASEVQKQGSTVSAQMSLRRRSSAQSASRIA